MMPIKISGFYLSRCQIIGNEKETSAKGILPRIKEGLNLLEMFPFSLTEMNGSSLFYCLNFLIFYRQYEFGIKNDP